MVSRWNELFRSTLTITRRFISRALACRARWCGWCLPFANDNILDLTRFHSRAPIDTDQYYLHQEQDYARSKLGSITASMNEVNASFTTSIADAASRATAPIEIVAFFHLMETIIVSLCFVDDDVVMLEVGSCGCCGCLSSATGEK